MTGLREWVLAIIGGIEWHRRLRESGSWGTVAAMSGVEVTARAASWGGGGAACSGWWCRRDNVGTLRGQHQRAGAWATATCTASVAFSCGLLCTFPSCTGVE